MTPPRPDGYADWQALAAGWERGRELLWDATRPVSEWLVERLAPRPGETVLELAGGTGETGFLAAPLLEPGGRLIASDRSPNMVEAARRRAAELGLRNVEFRTLDADAIDLPDRSVDGVLSRFGYILKGDPPPALAAIRRVLRPNGRVAFAVWAARERNPWMTVPAELMQELGHVAPPDADALRTSARRNPQAIRALLAAAGFADAAIVEMPVSYRFASAEELWLFVSELRGPLSLAFDALDAREQARVRAALEERAELTAGGGYALGGVSINVLAG